MRTPFGNLVMTVSLVAVVVLAACAEPSSSHQFTTVLQLSRDAPALPVVLRDDTGLVTGIESAPMDPGFDYAGPAARADQADPNAFVVRWLGGGCDNDALLRLTRNDGVYVLGVDVHGKFGFPGGCTAVGIPRDVRIVTSSPIPIDAIVAAGGT